MAEFELTFVRSQEVSIQTSNENGYFSEDEWALTRESVAVTNAAFASPLVLDRWRLGTIQHEGTGVKVLQILGSFQDDGDLNVAADVLHETAVTLGGICGTGFDQDRISEATPEEVVRAGVSVVILRLPLKTAMERVPHDSSLPTFIAEHAQRVAHTAPATDIEYHVEVSILAPPDADRAAVLDALREEMSLSWSEREIRRKVDQIEWEGVAVAIVNSIQADTARVLTAWTYFGNL
jgi:hypothetical protein